MTRRLALVAAAVAALVTVGSASAGGGQQWSGHRITVESRNLFVGFDAAALLSGAITTAQAWSTVLLSDPEGRASAWADEIAAARPDVVGLQEATLFRTGPVFNPAPAAAVAFDYVALLVDALADRGLTYVPVATAANLDAEVPVGPPHLIDVRLTDRDVLLVRAVEQTGALKVLDAAAGNFAATLPAGPFLFKRGWNAVDLELHGARSRVVNTHLEALHEGIRFTQASELLAGPAANPGPTILIGDFNSGAPEPTPTYGLLTGQFSDVWPVVGSGPGLTCCHDDLTPAIPYNERIDLVLTGAGITPLSADVIGDVPGASFPFFASDHAGIVATVELP
jgi:endonuclease/exonuclease/phosphatase family metal-dependent hydrolase